LKMKARPNATSMNIDDMTSMFAKVPTTSSTAASFRPTRRGGREFTRPRSSFYLIHPTAADFATQNQ